MELTKNSNGKDLEYGLDNNKETTGLLGPDSHVEEAEPDKKSGLMGYVEALIYSMIAMDDSILYSYLTSLMTIFTEKEVDSKIRNILSYCMVPVLLKVLVAPVVDRFFIQKLGRRRTYIYPCKILSLIFCFAISIKIDDMVENNEVLTIAIMLAIYSLFLMPLVNATNSLRLEHFGRKNASLIGAITAVQYLAGALAGFLLFTLLNSDSWCQKYLKTEKKVITHRDFWLFLGCLNVFSLFGFLLYKQKKVVPGEVSDKIGIFKSFSILLNPKLPLIELLLILCVTPISIIAFRAASAQYYIKNGIEREDFIFVSLLVTPIGIIMGLLWGKKTSKDNPMKKMWFTSLVIIITNFMHVPNIYFFDKESPRKTLIILFVIMTIDQSVPFNLFVAAAVNGSASKIYGSTFLASGMAVLSWCKFLLMFLILPLIDYISIGVAFACICCVQIGINILLYPRCKKIDEYELTYYQTVYDAKVEDHPLPDRESFKIPPKSE